MAASSLIECAVCNEAFCSDKVVPRMLKCGHTFCEGCLGGLGVKNTEGTAVTCPTCRQVTQLRCDECPSKNFALLEHIEAVQNARKQKREECSVCDNEAECGCKECKCNFCANHWTLRHEGKLRAHKKVDCIVTPESNTMPCSCHSEQAWTGATECISHSGRPLDLVCTDSNCPASGELMCLLCLLSEPHKNHSTSNTILVNQMATAKRLQLEEAVTAGEEKVSEVVRYLAEVRSLDEQLHEKQRVKPDAGKASDDVDNGQSMLQRVLDNVAMRYAILRRLLNRQEQSLLQRVRLQAEVKVLALEKENEKAASYLSQLYSVLRCTKSAVNDATDLQVLSSDQSHLNALNKLTDAQFGSSCSCSCSSSSSIFALSQELSNLQVDFERLPQLADIDVDLLARTAKQLTTDKLVELFDADDDEAEENFPLVDLLPDEAMQGDLSEGAGNALNLLMSADPRGQPLGGVSDFLQCLSGSRHAMRLLTALVAASSDELSFEGRCFGDQEAKAIADGLKICSTLCSLDLYNNEIQCDGCTAIADALKVNSTLTAVRLSNNLIGDAGCTAIAAVIKVNSALTSLRFSGNLFGVTGCTAIADALTVNTTLTDLRLSGNHRIGDEEVCLVIASILKNNRSLTQLSLYNDHIGDAGCAAIADALKTNATLTTLWLNENEIGDAGCMALADALKFNTTLKELKLEDNQIDEAISVAEEVWGSRLGKLSFFSE